MSQDMLQDRSSDTTNNGRSTKWFNAIRKAGLSGGIPNNSSFAIKAVEKLKKGALD